MAKANLTQSHKGIPSRILEGIHKEILKGILRVILEGALKDPRWCIPKGLPEDPIADPFNNYMTLYGSAGDPLS